MSDVIVRTRYSGATDSEGARVWVDPITASAVARHAKGFPYDYGSDDAHRMAVDQYAAHWSGDGFLVEFLGSHKGGRGNLYRITWAD